MLLIIVIKMMTRGFFLLLMSTYYDGVGNLDDIDLGDDFLGKLCLWMVSTYDDVVDENYQVRLSELSS